VELLSWATTPPYSDSQISEAVIAEKVNAIANSNYWGESAIVITYDESEGDNDHVPPRILSYDPSGLPLRRGPRIPLIVISPFARAHAVAHEEGDHNSVIRLVNSVFGLPRLATLPDEAAARLAGAQDPQVPDRPGRLHPGVPQFARRAGACRPGRCCPPSIPAG
jgi:phospholipase C